ncbi:MAG: yrdA, partial [Francisellaceae bacterium]|nr:yrdA [Francisellaceae bacterium]
MSIKKILINTILGGVLIVFSPLIYSLPLTIQLTGLAEPERLQVLNSLTIYNAKDSQTLTKEQMISFHQLASLEIKEALESLGYYHAVLISTLRPSIHEEWLAEYEITPNKQTHIQNVRISITGPGSHEPLLQKIIQNNALKKGDAFKHALYDETKKNLINTAIELGYIQALLSNNTVYLNRNTNLADIELILATGPLYHFGEVDFENTVYPADFLSKYITFKKGDPYTAYQLLAFQKALTETNLFSKIRFYPEVAKGENLDVPLKVKLNNKPKNKYTASLGYGTDTYYRMMFGWEKKLLVLPGHKINIDLKASKIQNRIQLRYSLPGKRPRQENKEFIMRVLQYKTPDYFSERSDISMSKFKRVGAWNQIWTLMYLTELYRFTPDTQKLRSHFLLPTAHVIWSRSDKEDNYIKKG